jgi:hypothetical protein
VWVSLLEELGLKVRSLRLGDLDANAESTIVSCWAVQSDIKLSMFTEYTDGEHRRETQPIE